MRVLAFAVLACGCYSARSAAPDVNAAWRGRARVELEARIGPATQEGKQPDGTTALKWVGHGTNIVALPSGHLDLKISPTSFSLAQLQNMPSRTQITRHDCVEGWSCIAKWTGTPLAGVLDLSWRALAWEARRFRGQLQALHARFDYRHHAPEDDGAPPDR